MSNSFCGTAIPSAFAVLRFDDQLELGGLLDGKIGGSLAFEDSACIASGKLHDVQKIGAVTYQPAGFDIGAIIEGRGDRPLQRQLGNMCAADEEKSVGAEHDRVAGLLRDAGESLVDLAIGAGAKNFDPNTNARCRDLQVLDKGCSEHRRRIGEHKIARCIRRQIAK
jgi:hypothetical protein